jgi:hypothetical protein
MVINQLVVSLIINRGGLSNTVHTRGSPCAVKSIAVPAVSGQSSERWIGSVIVETNIDLPGFLAAAITSESSIVPLL